MSIDTTPDQGVDSMIDLERIRTTLESKPRDLLLFDLITQSGIHVRYLLELTVQNLSGLNIGDKYVIPELAGKKNSSLIMTDKLHGTWEKYINAVAPAPGDYVIKSRKGSGPLRLTSASLMIKKWFEAAGLNGQNGIRRLRKSYAINEADGTIVQQQAKRIEEGSSSTELTPVKVKTVNESVYEKLFNAIITGRIPPGERLVTHKLAREMNVSQAPVREALRLLEAAGLTSAPQKKGSYVNELSAENFDEIFEIRLMLEVRASQKAALNIDETGLNTLRSLRAEFAGYSKEKNIEKMIDINKRFHYTIYSYANMPMILTLIKLLWDRMSPYVHLLFRVADSSYNLGIDNHQSILSALESRDPKAVSKTTKIHLQNARRQLMRFFHRL